MLLIDSGRYKDYEKRQTYLFSQCWKGVVNEAIPQLCILQGSTYLLRYFQTLVLLVTGVLKRESDRWGEGSMKREKKKRKKKKDLVGYDDRCFFETKSQEIIKTIQLQPQLLQMLHW